MPNNKRMDAIFAKSEALGNHTLHGSTEKKKAVAKKMSKKDTFDTDYHHFVRHHSSAEIGERWKKEWSKKK